MTFVLTSGHSVRGCTQYAGMDTDNGELVLVTEWTLQWRNPKRKLDLDDQEQTKEQVGNYLKQVTSKGKRDPNCKGPALLAEGRIELSL